jgi:MraZ protein
VQLVNRSFCGEYKCSADAKGRLLVPSRLRELFPEGQSVYLVRSLDRCVNLYTEERWSAFEEKILALPETESRTVRRFFYASMQDVEPDGQGRILLPAGLREYAGITKSVIVIGCGDHVEIWDEENYLNCITQTRTASVEEILKRNGL